MHILTSALVSIIVPNPTFLLGIEPRHVLCRCSTTELYIPAHYLVPVTLIIPVASIYPNVFPENKTVLSPTCAFLCL